MRKYKVGERVRVARDWRGAIRNVTFDDSMKHYLGKELTVQRVLTKVSDSVDDAYKLEGGGGWTWIAEALEPVSAAFKVGDKVKIVRSYNGPRIVMTDSKEAMVGNGVVYTVTKLDVETGCLRLDNSTSQSWMPECLELVDDTPQTTPRKVAFRFHNRKRTDALEAEVGTRGKAKVGSANRLKAKLWVCAAAHVEIKSLDDVGDAELAEVYNDTSNEKLKTLAQELEKVTVVPEAVGRLATMLMSQLPQQDESKIVEVVERILAERSAPKLIVLDKTAAQPVPLEVGRQHYKFELLLRCIGQGLHVALVGGAGTGKTTGAEFVAQALGRKFYPKSFSRMTTESGLMGYMDAGGKYHGTVFREAFEHGGVFCGDEFDAGNENVNVALNAALSNGFCSFPDGVVKKHPQFVCVIAMNTYGMGANRQYVGRNQLDAATMDRFVVIEWDIDDSIEAGMAGVEAGQQKFDLADGGTVAKPEWLTYVQAVRRAVAEAEVRHVVSPRAVKFGCALIDAGIGRKHIEEMALWKGLDAEQRERVQEKLK